MPRCGATCDEMAFPFGQRGTSGGLRNADQPTPALRATPPIKGIFKRGKPIQFSSP